MDPRRHAGGDNVGAIPNLLLVAMIILAGCYVLKLAHPAFVSIKAG